MQIRVSRADFIVCGTWARTVAPHGDTGPRVRRTSATHPKAVVLLSRGRVEIDPDGHRGIAVKGTARGATTLAPIFTSFSRSVVSD